MLSPSTRKIISATVPVLEQHGTTITSVFYKNMLSEHEELKNIFNRTNQVQGGQPTALATTVLAAAKNIDQLEALLPHVKQIGHKHRALQIKPEHYPIVGKHLLGAIKQVLGDAATPEVLNAWGEAYGAIADIFIGVEKQLYSAEGWNGWKQFEVVAREPQTSSITKMTVKPTQESGLQVETLSFTPGQYITIKTHPTNHNNKYDALRHYSICSSSSRYGLKFAFKKEVTGGHEGLVSTYLHDSIKVGDVISLSAPAGDFALDKTLIKQDTVPLVLLSSGVGATPILSMLEQQIESNAQRPIAWIQSSFNEANRPFASQVEKLLAKCANATAYITNTESMPRISSQYLSDKITKGSDIYICGSVQFMQDMLQSVRQLGIEEQSIHYEPFGPKMATVSV
ncbi:LADA_0E14994g1_1 [Lachancea dasiensis]|uniref:nitric oxide dioxygenase n=1 Tax=Lachancea dasiensis TaxID=1072105 RepID=A0A1G4JGA5_9SACH|nr:LADA_0E14994g1_1 [Lachancea dasiensis]